MYTFISIYLLSSISIITFCSYLKAKSDINKIHKYISRLASIERNCEDYSNYIAYCLISGNTKEAKLFLKYLEEEVIKGELIAERLKELNF